MNEFYFFAPKTGLIDWWSAAHLIWGWLLGVAFILLKDKFLFLKKIKYFFLSGLVISILWEILEVLARLYGKHLNVFLVKPMAEHENLINALSDIGVNMIGLGIIYLFLRIFFFSPANNASNEL